MQLFTVVNRTQRTLQGIWNGRYHKIPPGKSAFPELEAMAFKRQNPIMGTEDPLTGEIQFYLGIEEHGDPLDPIDEASLKPAIEKWDRDKLVGARPTQVVAGENGLYGIRVAGTGASSDTGFVKP